MSVTLARRRRRHGARSAVHLPLRARDRRRGLGDGDRAVLRRRAVALVPAAACTACWCGRGSATRGRCCGRSSRSRARDDDADVDAVRQRAPDRADRGLRRRRGGGLGGGLAADGARLRRDLRAVGRDRRHPRAELRRRADAAGARDLPRRADLLRGLHLLAWALLFAGRGPVVALFRLGPEGAAVVDAFVGLAAGGFVFAGALFVANAAFNTLGRPLFSTGVQLVARRDRAVPARLGDGAGAGRRRASSTARRWRASWSGPAAAWTGWRFVRGLQPRHGAGRLGNARPSAYISRPNPIA